MVNVPVRPAYPTRLDPPIGSLSPVGVVAGGNLVEATAQDISVHAYDIY